MARMLAFNALSFAVASTVGKDRQRAPLDWTIAVDFIEYFMWHAS
jgi:hypothetical protein